MMEQMTRPRMTHGEALAYMAAHPIEYATPEEEAALGITDDLVDRLVAAAHAIPLPHSGRPSLSSHGKESRRINVRLSDYDDAALTLAAERRGMKKTALARELISAGLAAA